MVTGYASPGKLTQEGSKGSGNVGLELRALRPGGEARLSHLKGTGGGKACSCGPWGGLLFETRACPAALARVLREVGGTVICLECEGGGDGTQRLEDSRTFKIVTAEKKGGHYNDLFGNTEDLGETRLGRGHL